MATHVDRGKIAVRWPVFFAVVVLAAAGAAKWNATMEPLGVTVTRIVYPKPNGYDGINDAARMLNRRIDDITWDGPLLTADGRTHEKRLTTSPKYLTYTIADFDSIVSENTPSFEKLEQALSLPCVARPYDIGAFGGHVENEPDIEERKRPECGAAA